jgi:hypothetical protein
MEAFLFVCRVLLGMVFLMASLTKFPRLTTFGAEIQQCRILPPRAAVILARLLPSVELGLAIGLLTGIYVGFAGVAAFVLIAVFLTAALSAIWRKLSIGCACFGLLFRMPINRYTVTRDLVLLTLAGVVFVGRGSEPTFFGAVANISSPWSISVVFVTLAMTSICLWVVYLSNQRKAPRGVIRVLADDAIG